MWRSVQPYNNMPLHDDPTATSRVGRRYRQNVPRSISRLSHICHMCSVLSSVKTTGHQQGIRQLWCSLANAFCLLEIITSTLAVQLLRSLHKGADSFPAAGLLASSSPFQLSWCTGLPPGIFLHTLVTVLETQQTIWQIIHKELRYLGNFCGL